MTNILRVSGIFIVIILSLMSLMLRWADFSGKIGMANLEAPYHVLHTLHSLDASSWTHHYFLPSVTLGRDLDKGIAWGDTVPTKTGDFIYTSFPPLGFIAPYAALKAVGADFTLRNLALFNVVLGTITAILLFVFLFELIRYIGKSDKTALYAALGATLIAIFSREALQSHGLIYWSHSLYQVVLACALLFLFFYLTSGRSRGFKLAFLLCIFVGPLIEWSAFVLSAGVALLLWFGFFPDGAEREKDRRLAIQVVALTALSGVLIYLHFVVVLGIGPATYALIMRFLTRSGANGSISHLVSGYGLSYGLFFLTMLVILLLTYAAFLKQAVLKIPNSQTVFAMFMVALMPLAENLLMVQHASIFSFDRLKLIFPAAIIFALGLALYPPVVRAVLALFLLLASLTGIKDYRRSISEHDQWIAVNAANERIAKTVLGLVDAKCTVFAASKGVRSYLNGLLGVSIYEFQSPEDLAALKQKTKACSAVFIEERFVLTNLPELQRVQVILPDGTSKEITPSATNQP